MSRVLIIARACAEEPHGAHVELRFEHEAYPNQIELIGAREAAAAAYTEGTGKIACRVGVVVLPWIDGIDEGFGVLRAVGDKPTRLTTYRCAHCAHTEAFDPRDWQETLPACPVIADDYSSDAPTDLDDAYALCPGSFMQPVTEAEAA